MAKKVTKKANVGLIDYWVGTITGAVIIGTSAQYLLGTLSTYITPWFSSNENDLYGNQSMPIDFLWAQLVTACIGLSAAVLILMVRKPKP